MTREELEALNIEESAINKILEDREQLKSDYELTNKLKESKAKSEKAVKALLEKEGEKSIDEQLEILKKEHGYLFEQEEIRVNSGAEHSSAVKEERLAFSFTPIRKISK